MFKCLFELWTPRFCVSVGWRYGEPFAARLEYMERKTGDFLTYSFSKWKFTKERNVLPF